MQTPERKARMDEIEELCLADYEEHVHKILLADFVIGFRGEDSVEVYLDPPARVRVQRTTDVESDIFHWNDDWCDPYWDVELIEPHPQLADVRSLWVDGKSRSLNGQSSIPKPGWIVDPNQEPAYQPPQPERCLGCGHTEDEGCGCPPRTQTHTMNINCPCCGKSLTVTVVTTVDA